MYIFFALEKPLHDPVFKQMKRDDGDHSSFANDVARLGQCFFKLRKLLVYKDTQCLERLRCWIDTRELSFRIRLGNDSNELFCCQDPLFLSRGADHACNTPCKPFFAVPIYDIGELLFGKLIDRLCRGHAIASVRF